MHTGPTGATVYADFQGLNRLRREAGENPDAALEQVASQFEAIFVQMMLKSMRDASLGEGILDSGQSSTYLEMFDQQIALEMSRGGNFGIAQVLIEQLRQHESVAPDRNTNTVSEPGKAAGGETGTGVQESLPGAVDDRVTGDSWRKPADFIEFMRPMAESAGARLGVSADVLVAQAALETGWGRKIIRNSDGSSSYNLFGIKADSRWQGPVAVVDTLEFRGGVAQVEKAAFRSYESFAQSFADYVDFVTTSERYREAMNHGGNAESYIRSLQQAEYATDPAYADKVIDIMQRDYG